MLNSLINNCLINNQTCFLCALAPAGATGICDACYQDLPWLHSFCPRCAEPDQAIAGKLCPHCAAKRPTFQQVRAAFRYQFPIDAVIKAVKYGKHPEYLRSLSLLLAQRIRSDCEQLPECLIPIPAHRQRLRERGFNQAQLIAELLSHQLQIPLLTPLRKVVATEHQARLDRSHRLTNLLDTFSLELAGTNYLPYQHVALIDDVMTTGATAEAVARLLTRKGVKRIEVWVLARTPNRHNNHAEPVISVWK